MMFGAKRLVRLVLSAKVAVEVLVDFTNIIYLISFKFTYCKKTQRTDQN